MTWESDSVFFYLFEKRIVSVKQLELESVHQILNVPSLLFSETHGVPGCEHMSLDGSLGALGESRSLSLDLCNSKMFSYTAETKGGGNSVHQQKKTPF